MRLFHRGDVDGFFGLFVDNLAQLLLIAALCTALCGMSGENAHFVHGRMLPGAALSVLVGNLFYAWQAHRLARREGRTDVTALPYGINTPSLLVYVFFVMAPVYRETGSAEKAWQMGLLACLGSGLIELLGAFVAEGVRRRTPRAALLSTLAGIAIGFIAMTFALRIWAAPVVAMGPMVLVLITYFSQVPLPGRVPGGLAAIVVGTALAWLLPSEWSGVRMEAGRVASAWSQVRPVLPHWSGGAVWQALELPAEGWVRFLSVILPMGLFNVVGSLQNIESAEAGGDRYDTRSSLAVNGMGSILASLLGSCFPTTIYIGHPGWKALGARAGYSTLNGLAITMIGLTGTLALVQEVIPLESAIAIVMWIGIVITAQAFQATPRAHAPAVAVGLFPAIAAWGATVVWGAFVAAGGRTMQEVLSASRSTEVSGFLLHGLAVFDRGYILTCMILSALSAALIDRRFFGAAVWAMIGGAAAGLGLAHAYQLSGNDLDYLLAFASAREGTMFYRAADIAVGYALMAGVCVLVGVYQNRPGAATPDEV
jgi:AGZA family xanthine/uracil permease-like MFS transporter